jgi:hypothetical protein
VRSNDDADNERSDEMTGKQEMEQDEKPVIPEHPGSSPKHKSLRDLSVRIKTMVAEEAVDDVGL